MPGGLGVTIFFFLTGHLITTLLLEEYQLRNSIDIAGFFVRRFIRLAPPVLLVLVLSYAMVWLGALPGEAHLKGFVAQFFYFANYYAIFFDGGGLVPKGTGILWSLAVEEHFYLFYPFIFLSLIRNSSKTQTTKISIAICLDILLWRINLAAGPGFNPDRTYYASDTRIDSILLGCVLAMGWNFARRQLVEEKGGMTFQAWALLAVGTMLLCSTLFTRDTWSRETIRYTI